MADIKRKLATIETVLSVSPIPDADLIEKITIRGWNVVVKKGDFKVGDLVVYCEIDSVLPEIPAFEFLRSRGFRIRTIKLKNQISQGIVFSLDILDNFGDFVNVIGDPRWTSLLVPFGVETTGIPIVEGEDLTDAMGVQKYEVPIPACLAGLMKGDFPSSFIKSDEIRIQNLV